LFRLCQLGLTLTKNPALAPRVEEVIAEVNTKRAEITGQKWNIVLVTVTSKGVHVRHIEVCFSQVNRGIRFLHFVARFSNLGMGCNRRSHTRFARADWLHFRGARIQIQCSREGQSYGVVELQPKIGEL